MGIGDTIQKVIDDLRDNNLVPGLIISEDVTVTNVTQGTYDTETGISSDSIVAIAAKAIVRDLSLSEVANSDGLFQTGDVTFLVFKSSTLSRVNESDTITWGSDTYRVIRILEPQLDGSTLLFRVIGRKT